MWPFASNARPNDVRATPSIRKTSQADDAELASLFQSLESSEKQAAAQVQAPTPAIGGFAPPIAELKHETLPDGRRVYEDGTVDISPDRMYPHSMSCRQAFDQAFYCQSLRGKFNSLYRYGEFKSCSEQWGAFWFCMRTRTLGDDTRTIQTMDYYRNRDIKRKEERGSSEDVWEIRNRSVREAFGKDPDAVDAPMAVQS